MGRITLGDVAFGALLALVLYSVIMVATALILFVGLGFSADDYITAMMITASAFFLAGGILLGTRSQRAGYPVVTTWAWGAGIIVVVQAVILGVRALTGNWLGADAVLELLLPTSVLLLGLFFAIGLAGFLNSRYSGAPMKRFQGTRSGGMFTGVPIYRSNQPAIYQGVKELDFDDKAPGTLYRRRQ